jgi:hypothetical protein
MITVVLKMFRQSSELHEQMQEVAQNMFLKTYTRGCTQKFRDWPPGARTTNGIALCHQMQLYRYSVRCQKNRTRSERRFETFRNTLLFYGEGLLAPRPTPKLEDPTYYYYYYCCYYYYSKSRDSSVGMALGYGLDDRGSRVLFPEGGWEFSLHHRVQNGSGAHPASYTMGTRRSFLGVKRPRREADHSPPSSAEVKNELSYTFTPPIRLHGVVLS